MTADVRPGRFSEPVPREIPERFELIRVRIPLLDPFVTAHGAEHDRDLVIVRAVAADGAEGWGECSTLSFPGYSPEYTEGAWAILAEVLAPALLDGRGSEAARSNPMAVTGLEVACVDLALRRVARSLAVEFGPAVERLPVGVVVGLQTSIDDLLLEVERRVAEGYGQVKLKVTPEWFLEPLQAIRANWPALALAADGNGSLGAWWDERDAQSIDTLAALDLDYLEQPLPPDRLADCARFVSIFEGDVPIALDESIPNRKAFDSALRTGLDPFIVNVKPARLGGLAETRDLLHEITDAGCSAFVGGMLESGVGRATALAVATSPVCNRIGDLGPSDRYFARDVITDPFCLIEGTLRVPHGAGIGIDVDLEALDAFAVDRVAISRH